MGLTSYPITILQLVKGEEERSQNIEFTVLGTMKSSSLRTSTTLIQEIPITLVYVVLSLGVNPISCSLICIYVINLIISIISKIWSSTSLYNSVDSSSFLMMKGYGWFRIVSLSPNGFTLKVIHIDEILL